MPTEINEGNIEEVKNSDNYWLIDFWAEWCGPCKKLKPVFKEVSEEMDLVKFGKVDMEESQDIGTDFGVRALPTLIIIKNGEEIARKSGAMPKHKLKDWIKTNID